MLDGAVKKDLLSTEMTATLQVYSNLNLIHYQEFRLVIYLLRNPLGPLTTWAHMLDALLLIRLKKMEMKEMP